MSRHNLKPMSVEAQYLCKTFGYDTSEYSYEEGSEVNLARYDALISIDKETGEAFKSSMGYDGCSHYFGKTKLTPTYFLFD